MCFVPIFIPNIKYLFLRGDISTLVITRLNILKVCMCDGLSGVFSNYIAPSFQNIPDSQNHHDRVCIRIRHLQLLSQC